MKRSTVKIKRTKGASAANNEECSGGDAKLGAGKSWGERKEWNRYRKLKRKIRDYHHSCSTHERILRSTCIHARDTLSFWFKKNTHTHTYTQRKKTMYVIEHRWKTFDSEWEIRRYLFTNYYRRQTCRFNNLRRTFCCSNYCIVYYMHI